MFSKIKNSQTLKMIADTKNLGLYLLVVIALSVTWSSIKVIQKNYGLEKQITALQQEDKTLDQQNKNQNLENEYYQSNAYLDLAARKYFDKAAPGEKLILVPSTVSQQYIHAENDNSVNQVASKPNPKIIQNWQNWINFFSHRQY